jgi:hypothetical protein
MVSTLAMTDALAKLMIAKGILTERLLAAQLPIETETVNPQIPTRDHRHGLLVQAEPTRNRLSGCELSAEVNDHASRFQHHKDHKAEPSQPGKHA